MRDAVHSSLNALLCVSLLCETNPQGMDVETHTSTHATHTRTHAAEEFHSPSYKSHCLSCPQSRSCGFCTVGEQYTERINPKGMDVKTRTTIHATHTRTYAAQECRSALYKCHCLLCTYSQYCGSYTIGDQYTERIARKPGSQQNRRDHHTERTAVSEAT